MRNKILLFTFGVLLPVAVIVLESLTGVCQQAFWSPIPDPLHIAVVAAVPTGNLFLFLRTSSLSYRPGAFDVMVAAIVLAIASVYSFLFLPLMPIAGIGILMGITNILRSEMLVMLYGICPLVPAGSLVAAGIFTRRILRAREEMKSVGWIDAFLSSGGLCTLYCFLVGIIWSVVP